MVVMVAGAEILTDLDDGLILALRCWGGSTGGHVARCLRGVRASVAGSLCPCVAQVPEHDDLALALALCLPLRAAPSILRAGGDARVVRIEPLGGFALYLFLRRDLAFGGRGEDGIRHRHVRIARFDFRLSGLGGAVPSVLVRAPAHAPLLSASCLVVRRGRTALHEAVGDAGVVLPFEADA